MPTLETKLHPIEQYQLPTYRVDRKVYRVGATYPYDRRMVALSLPSAAGGFLSAHYRQAHGVVKQASTWYLNDHLPYLDVPSGRCRHTDVTAALSERIPGDEVWFEPPVAFAFCNDADEVALALVHAGPVLAYLEWPSALDLQSRAHGENWLGPDGRDFRGPWESLDWRCVLIKGVSHRYGGVRVQIDDGRPDSWMSFGTLNRLLARGWAFTGFYDAG